MREERANPMSKCAYVVGKLDGPVCNPSELGDGDGYRKSVL